MGVGVEVWVGVGVGVGVGRGVWVGVGRGVGVQVGVGVGDAPRSAVGAGIRCPEPFTLVPWPPLLELLVWLGRIDCAICEIWCGSPDRANPPTIATSTTAAMAMAGRTQASRPDGPSGWARGRSRSAIQPSTGRSRSNAGCVKRSAGRSRSVVGSTSRAPERSAVPSPPASADSAGSSRYPTRRPRLAQAAISQATTSGRGVVRRARIRASPSAAGSTDSRRRVQRVAQDVLGLEVRHASRSSTLRSAAMARAVWLLTAPRLMPMIAAICASDMSP